MLTWLQVQEQAGFRVAALEEEEWVRTVMSGKVHAISLTSIPAKYTGGVG